jgi:hypothetical protein
LLAQLAGSAPQIAAAKDHGEKHRKDRDGERHRKYGDNCFREEHVVIMRDYYRPRSLPPGIEKKLYRTGHLPPGWEKKVQPFPVVLEQRLPPVCAGCARGYMDGYAVVYQPQSRVIIDVHAIFTP